MPTIGIVSPDKEKARHYLKAISKRGPDCVLIESQYANKINKSLAGIHGIIITGGLDINPERYGEVPDPTASLHVSKDRDEWEIPIVKQALDKNMPILGICRGMQLLNVVFGGKLIQDLPGHKSEDLEGDIDKQSSFHQIYLSPGTKLAAIMGSGGFIRVNSRHHQGLGEPQKAPTLMASAYSLEDGIIEAIESPKHDWVIGVQWHNELEEELYKTFGNLFEAFIERSDRFANITNPSK